MARFGADGRVSEAAGGRALVILGTGGHAAVILDLALACGKPIKGCLGPGTPALDPAECPHLGEDDVLDTLDRAECDAIVAVGSIGNSDLRRRLFELLVGKGFHCPALVHPRATVSPSARLGDGAQIMAGAVVQANASIGANVIVNTAAVVEHHVSIGGHAHVAPGAVVCGGAQIGMGAHVGANATVLQGLSVGAGAVVGAGGVVVRDVGPRERVTGVPAR